MTLWSDKLNAQLNDQIKLKFANKLITWFVFEAVQKNSSLFARAPREEGLH